MKNNYLVSVIVPVYNVEKYLEKCIRSILDNTYEKFELILVDDGSTDLSGQICDRWKDNDNRIMVIHKDNGGLSSARNAGMNVAKGEYIFFVDSDDYIDNKAIEICVNNMKKNDVDMIQFNYYKVNEMGDIITECSFSDENRVIAYNDVENELYKKSDKAIVVNAWNKFYKRELIKNIKFVEGKNYEDNMFLSDVIDSRPNVLLITESVYYYVQRENSITTGSFSDKKLDRIYAMDYILRKYNIHSTIYKYVSCWKVSVLFQLYFEAYMTDPGNNKDILKYLKKEFNKTIANCFLTHGCIFKYIFFIGCPNLFCRIYKGVRK